MYGLKDSAHLKTEEVVKLYLFYSKMLFPLGIFFNQFFILLKLIDSVSKPFVSSVGKPSFIQTIPIQTQVHFSAL